MQTFLTSVEIIVAALLCATILMQTRSSGLSQSFGGSGAITVQRRGAEKILYQATIVLGVIFFVIPVVQWFTA